MKLISVFLIIPGWLFAQSPIILSYDQCGNLYEAALNPSLDATIRAQKAQQFFKGGCLAYPLFDGLLGPFGYAGKANDSARPSTGRAFPNATGTLTTDFSPVDSVLAPFYNYYSGGGLQYSPLFRSRSVAPVRPDLTTIQAVPPPDPQLIFLDGFGTGLIAIDMTTLSVVSQVAVPSLVGPFGIRPATGGNEVWVANYGSEVTVVDLATQNVITNIQTPSIAPTISEVPQVGFAFTPDGATALEAIKYYTPDSSGNSGALLVFDAANRTVTSTMPLKFEPAALVMAPDGLTAYLLSSKGNITYYDVLSGTADLTLSTYTPGMNGGYPGLGPVYIHPDGTRLFWNINYLLVVFDLTAHTTTTFTSGLSSSAAPTFDLSQDGGTAYFTDKAGDVVIMNTQHGTILGTINTGAPTSVFAGPPVAP
jgi:YVTN family beta-propeller protein